MEAEEEDANTAKQEFQEEMRRQVELLRNARDNAAREFTCQNLKAAFLVDNCGECFNFSKLGVAFSKLLGEALMVCGRCPFAEGENYCPLELFLLTPLFKICSYSSFSFLMSRWWGLANWLVRNLQRPVPLPPRRQQLHYLLHLRSYGWRRFRRSPCPRLHTCLPPLRGACSERPHPRWNQVAHAPQVWHRRVSPPGLLRAHMLPYLCSRPYGVHG